MREVLLVIRPEDKSAVESVLLSEIGVLFSSYPVLGRGREGALRYKASAKKGLRRFLPRTEHRMDFLPKLAFLLFVEDEAVASLLDSVGAALRHEGGPADCALGFAAVTDVSACIAVGDAGGAAVLEVVC